MEPVGLLLLLVVPLAITAVPCNKEYFDQDSFVCTCGGNICDTVEPVGVIERDQAVVYSTSADGDRLTRSVKEFERISNSGETNVVLELDSKADPLQWIFGFGGAITDAVASIYNKGSPSILLDQYYGRDSIEYSVGRVPIGSCDFSETPWSYSEVPEDYELRHFNTSQDPKIDILHDILHRTPDLQLFASPWSAPGWMKRSGQMKGGGDMKGGFNGVYYLTYAKYLVNFFKFYYSKGIKFWGMTVQNEPMLGADPNWRWQNMHLSPQMQRDFVNKRLRPLFKRNNITANLKIMGHDDARNSIFDAAKTIYDKNAHVENEVDGLAVHWYAQVGYDPLRLVHKLRPDKFILATEACNAYEDEGHTPLLGSWGRAQAYAHDIIQNLLNYVSGWTDWNIWLDEQGGPNWVGNFVDAPIIVDTERHVFYKQPMYYILGHFSKFIRPNSFRIQMTQNTNDSSFEAVGFIVERKRLVVVAHNRSPDKTFEVVVKKKDAAKGVRVTLGPKSIKTVLFNNN